MKLVSASQIAQIDNRAIDEYGILSTRLMENAGKQMSRCVGPLFGKAIVVFSGRGKNGGDGLVFARLAISQNASCVTVYMPKGSDTAPDTREMISRLLEYGGKIEEIDKVDENIREHCKNADILVDALFGTGLSREPSGIYADIIDCLNRSNGTVVSADLPSGAFADSGRVSPYTVKADKTITFTFAKPAHYLMPSSEYCGEVTVCDIGVPEKAYENQSFYFEAADEAFLEKHIRPRLKETHKGSYGKVLLICGSVDYTGSAFFAAQAAVRTGSGLTFLGVPRAIHPVLSQKCNEPIVFPLYDDLNGRLSLDSFDVILEKMRSCDALLIGPGLSRSKDTQELVRRVVLSSDIPTVLDADGINAFCGHIDDLKYAKAPVILTPHTGEFSRLTGIPADRITYKEAKSFAGEYGVTLLLKGHRTVTADASGRIFINTTGNPGMAKGGSGDVLSGIIVSLLGQGIKAPEAAALGAYIHGKAGDIAANRFSEYSMTPTDMLSAICDVLKKFNSKEW